MFCDSDDTIRQELIDAILASNQLKTTPGYENGFAKMIEDYPENLMNFTDATNTSIKIEIPSFPIYIIGEGGLFD